MPTRHAVVEAGIAVPAASPPAIAMQQASIDEPGNHEAWCVHDALYRDTWRFVKEDIVTDTITSMPAEKSGQEAARST